MANSPVVRHRSAVRPETVGLVLASAATHAYWNAVVRRAGGDAVFIGSSKVVEAVLLFPALAVVMLRDPRLVAGATAWRLVAVRETLRRQCWPVVQVAVCNAASYLLVLLALRSGTSTYVVAARQSSVAFGALIGWYAFGESLDRAGIGAVALILAGALLVTGTR